MSFTKITTTELNSRGATTLPNQPAMSATALKQEFDAPAKNIVAPKFNNLVDELEATTAAASLGAVAPTGRVGNNVQGIMNSISNDLDTLAANASTAIAEAHAHPNKALLDDYTQTEADLADAVLQKHSHPNKALLDTYAQTETDLADAVLKRHTHGNKAIIDKFADDGTGLTYDGNPIRGAVESVNGKDGTVVLTASDVGALPSTTAIPTKTSDLTNDSNFVADASYVHTDNNYDATAKGIVDGATAAIAAKSTVAWNQNITTGQRIATVTIDGTPTDVYAPTGGGGGGAAALNDLNDVDIDASTLANKDILEFNAATGKFENVSDRSFVRYAGSITFNDLMSGALSTYLTSAYEDMFFLVTDGGTLDSTTAAYWTGTYSAGDVIPPDSHIAVINIAPAGSTPSYRFDDFGGYVDISGKADKTEIIQWVSGSVSNANSLTLTDSRITTNTKIACILGDNGTTTPVKYSAVSVAAGSITITFPEATTALIDVGISNA